MKKRYEVKIAVRVYEREGGGFMEHTVTFEPMGRNQIEALNSALWCLPYCVISDIESEIVSKRIGRTYKIVSYELDRIISIKLLKGEN